MNHYETHLTLATDEIPSLKTISDWAVAAGFKWTRIELEGGDTPDQPMVTFQGNGSLAEQQQRVSDVSQEILQRGGRIVRVKIEAAPSNDDVPGSDFDAASHRDQYFEHHVKIFLANTAETELLGMLAEKTGARLSRNIRRRRPDGLSERFVTQRVFARGRDYARRELHRLLTMLSECKFHVLEIEQEYVLFDSHLSLDAGWLPVPGERKHELA